MLAGVPQGSILGPVLLILFVNDVFQLSSKNYEIFLYADNAAIVFTGDNEAKLQMHIEMFCSAKRERERCDEFNQPHFTRVSADYVVILVCSMRATAIVNYIPST